VLHLGKPSVHGDDIRSDAVIFNDRYNFYVQSESHRRPVRLGRTDGVVVLWSPFMGPLFPGRHLVQELVRRRESKRELFYDDIVHVQASACAH